MTRLGFCAWQLLLSIADVSFSVMAAVSLGTSRFLAAMLLTM